MCNYAVIYAAQKDDLRILQWLHENGCPWNESICHNAVLHGRLEILKFAYENGLSFDDWTRYFAAQNGELEILKWMHEYCNVLCDEICIYAAIGGHLETLQWLHENGAPLNAKCYHYAKSYPDILKYLDENECPQILDND